MLFRCFLFISLFAFSLEGYSQCSEIVSKDCLKQFGEFVHDGNSSISEMKEGDTAELFKTFFAGQTYRIIVCKSEMLPSIHMRILSSDGSILFDNKDKDFELVWDFAVKGTQKLIVSLEVLKRENVEGKDEKSGCVAILFGIDKDK